MKTFLNFLSLKEVVRPRFGSHVTTNLEKDIEYLKLIFQYVFAEEEWMINHLIKRNKISFNDLVANKDFYPTIKKELNNEPDKIRKLYKAIGIENVYSGRAPDISEGERIARLTLLKNGFY